MLGFIRAHAREARFLVESFFIIGWSGRIWPCVRARSNVWDFLEGVPKSSVGWCRTSARSVLSWRVKYRKHRNKKKRRFTIVPASLMLNVLCLSPSVSFLCLFASQLMMVIFVKKIHKGAKNGLILLYCVLVRFRTLAFLRFRTF